MWTIAKTFKFSASHQLTGLSSDHQCARLHGHNYTVRLELSSTFLGEEGFVVDFGDLALFKAQVDRCDHRHLNDLFDFNPTSENLAHYFFLAAQILFPETSAVVVSETEATWARFSA